MHHTDFRPATADDFAFFFQLHKDTLGPYVEQVWGWDDEVQRTYLQRTIDYDTTQVIVVEGTDAGRLKVERRPQGVYLGLIEIAPSHQGRGIGTQIVRSLLDEAFADGKRVCLNVLRVNTSAYRLYRRLGFAQAAATEVRFQMVAEPPPLRHGLNQTARR
ncbi:hypothetical protein ASE48_03225 [Mycobacterium sp. Root265]|uniref:GNAT family N-acetyltransferase n=1 Tax=Mycobacterium sp. Root265 TaxID=1736504 RepID=UPI00070C5EE0|nr:GNAT family N-acetyltransferase [Mycobacterium sp. Root265]KRD20804.1 hypothetical protein ASE48_03225 [Mycobacterium sp. Root265]